MAELKLWEKSLGGEFMSIDEKEKKLVKLNEKKRELTKLLKQKVESSYRKRLEKRLEEINNEIEDLIYG